MQNLSEGENLVLGGTAALVEAVILQPTIYWKNAAQQGLEFTMNPRILWRGLAATCINEGGQMALQFWCTGIIKKLIAGKDGTKIGPGQEILAALAGGAITSPFAQVCEVTMIQQQRFGGSLPNTGARIIQEYGARKMLRGMTGVAIRDSLYVGALLGVTPILQDKFVNDYGCGMTSAGLYASVVGGMFAGILTCPPDAISTVMKGDLKSCDGVVAICRKQLAGGAGKVFGGVGWRCANLIGTIAIANECRVRFGPLMFPAKYDT